MMKHFFVLYKILHYFRNLFPFRSVPVNNGRPSPFKNYRIRFIKLFKKFLQIPTVYIVNIIKLNIYEIGKFFYPKIVLNRSDKNKTYIIVRIRTCKSPCTASTLAGIYNTDVLARFNLRQFFFYR